MKTKAQEPREAPNTEANEHTTRPSERWDGVFRGTLSFVPSKTTIKEIMTGQNATNPWGAISTWVDNRVGRVSNGLVDDADFYELEIRDSLGAVKYSVTVSKK